MKMNMGKQPIIIATMGPSAKREREREKVGECKEDRVRAGSAGTRAKLKGIRV